MNKCFKYSRKRNKCNIQILSWSSGHANKKQLLHGFSSNTYWTMNNKLTIILNK